MKPYVVIGEGERGTVFTSSSSTMSGDYQYREKWTYATFDEAASKAIELKERYSHTRYFVAQVTSEAVPAVPAPRYVMNTPIFC
jgi:hypothetical protein